MTVIVSIVNWWLDRVDSRLELLKVNGVACAYQLALIGLLAIFQVASADVLVLKNGDRLEGSVVRQEASELEFRASSFGQMLKVPLGEIESIERLEANQSEPASVAVESEPVSLAVESEPVSLAVESEPASLAVESEPVSLAVEPEHIRDTSPTEKPKLFELPENWNAEMSFGFSDRQGRADSREVSTEGRVSWKHGKNEAEWQGHYRYFDHEDKKAADRYGFAQRVRHRGDKGYFLQADTKGEVDNVIKKRTQLTQSVGLGYSPLKKESLNMNVAPGIKAEYTADAEDGSQKGTRYKANLQQDLSWRVNDEVAVGQGLSYSVDPSDDTNWDLDFNAYIETKVNKDMKMRVNYRRDFLNEIEGLEDKEIGEVGASLIWNF